MKQYLSSLNERERWVLILGSLCLFLYLYYLILYAPLSSSVTQKSNQLIEKKETLRWMKQVQGQAHTTQKKQQLDNSQLLSVIAKQLKSNQSLRVPFQLQQMSSGDIQLTFDNVPFNLFVRWLMKLNDKYAIEIKQFEVEHTDRPGVTRLMFILSARK